MKGQIISSWLVVLLFGCGQQTESNHQKEEPYLLKQRRIHSPKSFDSRIFFPANKIKKDSKERIYSHEDIPVEKGQNSTDGLTENPKFRGGLQNFYAIFNQRLTESAEMEMNGNVLVQFVIDSTGSLREPKILKGIAPNFDQAILDALTEISHDHKWFPGKVNGQACAKPVALSITVNAQMNPDH